MLYDPGFDHETGAPGLLPELGGVDEGPLPTADWAQALLDRRGARLSEMALDADDARPETLPPEAFDPIARKDQDAFVVFTRTDPPVTRVPPVIVEGEYDPDPDPYDDWWETGDGPPGYRGDGPGFDGGGGGGGDDGETDNDPCPNSEVYEDVAGAVGLLANVLGILKDTPASIGSRDDRAIEATLVSLEGLETALASGTIRLSDLEGVLGDILNIMLNEMSDTAIIGLGSAIGIGIAWWVDGPLPFGEALGGVVGAIAALGTSQFIGHQALADSLAKALLSHLNLENVQGPCSDD